MEMANHLDKSKLGSEFHILRFSFFLTSGMMQREGNRLKIFVRSYLGFGAGSNMTCYSWLMGFLW